MKSRGEDVDPVGGGGGGGEGNGKGSMQHY